MLVKAQNLLSHDLDEVFEFFYELQSPLIQIWHQLLTSLFKFNHIFSVDQEVIIVNLLLRPNVVFSTFQS